MKKYERTGEQMYNYTKDYHPDILGSAIISYVEYLKIELKKRIEQEKQEKTI